MSAAMVGAMAGAAAGSAASAAKSARCTEVISGYDPKLASIEGMQIYADCVQWLHPMSENSDYTLLRIGVFIFFGGVVFAAYKCVSERDYGSIPLMALVCGVAFSAVYFVIVGAGMALMWAIGV